MIDPKTKVTTEIKRMAAQALANKGQKIQHSFGEWLKENAYAICRHRSNRVLFYGFDHYVTSREKLTNEMINRYELSMQRKLGE